MQNVSEFEKSSIRKIGSKIRQMTCPEVPKSKISQNNPENRRTLSFERGLLHDENFQVGALVNS